MSDNSKIEWLDGGATWPVIRGCTKCSPGCDNCWAIQDAHLHAGSPNAKAAAHFAGLTQIVNGRPNWSGEVRLDESMLHLPLKWRKPRKVFVGSSSDLFHERVPFETIFRVFDVMKSAPQHTYLMLTKRAERMYEAEGKYGQFPINWWPGVSVEDEERARLRLPLAAQDSGAGAVGIVRACVGAGELAAVANPWSDSEWTRGLLWPGSRNRTAQLDSNRRRIGAGLASV